MGGVIRGQHGRGQRVRYPCGLRAGNGGGVNNRALIGPLWGAETRYSPCQSPRQECAGGQPPQQQSNVRSRCSGHTAQQSGRLGMCS